MSISPLEPMIRRAAAGLLRKEIVTAAYQGLLDREPDAQGEAGYLRSVTRTDGVLEVLSDIAHSDEIWHNQLRRRADDVARQLLDGLLDDSAGALTADERDSLQRALAIDADLTSFLRILRDTTAWEQAMGTAIRRGFARGGDRRRPAVSPSGAGPAVAVVPATAGDTGIPAAAARSDGALEPLDVVMAFRYLLGREPESEATIKAHLGLGSVDALRRAIMTSDEFRSREPAVRTTGSKWVATDVLDGYTMWVDLHDRYVSHGCLANNWEPSETAFLRARLAPGQCVFDIGANIGWFSLVAAGVIGASGSVHAFEPRPDTARMLRRTIRDNQLRTIIQLWEVALDEQAGQLHLAWYAENRNPGNTFFAPADGKASEGLTTGKNSVKAVRLDDLLPEVAPDIVKIDVEGAEPRVIAGARNALARKRPVILSELFPQQLRDVSRCSPADYIALMGGLGYGCYLLEEGKATRRLQDFPVDARHELVSVVFEQEGRR